MRSIAQSKYNKKESRLFTKLSSFSSLSLLYFKIDLITRLVLTLVEKFQIDSLHNFLFQLRFKIHQNVSIKFFALDFQKQC